jgi:hypothetical protein
MVVEDSKFMPSFFLSESHAKLYTTFHLTSKFGLRTS